MKGPIAAGLLALSSAAYAQISQKCQDGVCFSLNIPDATASSGTGDIFFQISAPTSMEWVALGQGSGMDNANIFVVYTAAGGTNVTVSPRLGSGHDEPEHNSNARLEVLSGSGVTDGSMIANVRCSSCNDWQVGTQSFSSSAGDWIWAYKSGDALDTNDPSASISQHDSRGTDLGFDFAEARGGSSSNPFTSSSGSGSGSSTSTGSSGSSSTATRCGSGGAWGGPQGGSATSGSSRPTGPPGGGSWGGWGGDSGGSWGGPQGGWGGSSDDNDGNNNGKRQADDACEADGSSSEGFGSNQGLSASRQTQLLMAHGILACLAFAILFPMGAIAVRLLSFPGLVMLHAAIQAVSYILYIVAFGIGIYLANNLDMIDEYHPVIGIVLFILLFFQAILGALHHSAFKKYQRRTLWSHGHLWLGRIVITLGIINGGLGFLLADNTTSGAIAYGVVAGIVWLVYVASIVIGERKRAKTGTSAYDPPKYEEVPPRPSETRGNHSGNNNDVPLEYYGNRHPTAQ